MPDPRLATYRVQLTPEQGFDAVAAAVPDLAALGVSHVYLSPAAEAVPGSSHGYDVVDPTVLRAELGGRPGFDRLVDACRAAGLRLLLDIVPNHLAAHARNPWWWDVLRLGRGSRHADLFDIDWTATDTVLLPVLGDHYGRELEAGRIRLERDGSALVLRYAEHTFPVRPETEAAIATEADLAAVQADVDRLDVLVGEQHYRLARWVVGDAEVEYRRFFDVDTLVATRMDRPGTFELLHELPAALVASGAVDGVRVDHVDGIADPAAYLARLREELGPDAWIVVEKIVRRDEDLPAWPVGGTTGYEVAELLGAWLTDPEGAEAQRARWVAWTGETRSYATVALEARREVLRTSFAADVGRVVDALAAVCEVRRRHRDHTRAALRAVVTELAAHLPVYRTYVTPRTEDGGARPEDVALLEAAAAAAQDADPLLDPELVDLVVGVLAGRVTGEHEALVVTRFQQLTGPVAAKGEEDTALYRWQPWPHRCEVGSDPARASATATDWHEACTRAQATWPLRLTTLSTHDTKRSADARARLAALLLDPAGTAAALERWSGALAEHRTDSVDRATEWSLFHLLVAGWPMDAARAWTVAEKSIREAGVLTSWARPDEQVEGDVRSLVEAALAEGPARAVLDELVARTVDAGYEGALAQLLAQLLAPGVPDVYQGGEAWDLSLVDPDNRRGVDPALRAELVAAAAGTDAVDAWAKDELRARGLPRTIVLRAALAARRRHPAAVGPGPAGAYVPLHGDGPDRDRVLAFGRGDPVELLVVVARPGRTAPDARVVLPPGGWTDAFTGERHDGPVVVGELLADFPVALLER